MHKNVLIFLFGLISVSLSGQELRPVISVEKDTILIGDQINLKIQVWAKPETKIAWPRFEDFLIPKVEIISRTGIDSSLTENNQLKLEQDLLITSFDTGYYEIPGLEFTYQNTGDEAFLKSISNSLDLHVYTIAVDTTQAIMPIKGPISSPYTWEEIWPWLLLGLIVVGMVIFLIYYFKRKGKQEPVFKPKSKPRIAPHIIALNGLEKLKSKKLWQEGKFKQYYTELIDIIRVYLEDQFGIDAMEMTSDEINEMVAREEKIDPKIKQKLAEALKISDLVKFAKEQPIANINDINLENLVEFVDKTYEIKKEDSVDEVSEAKEPETGITKIKEE